MKIHSAKGGCALPMNSISRHAESSFKNGSPVLNEMDSIQRILLSSTGNQCKCMTTFSELKMLILSVKKIRHQDREVVMLYLIWLRKKWFMA